MNKINVTQSSLPTLEEYINEIKDLWDSRWLTNMGVKHQKLEMELKEYLHTPNITLFTNGHIALESVIDASNLTGEVITTPFTFASTTHAITRNGLIPVFCDINESDYTIDIEKIESLITDKTSAIIPVHVYGNVCNYIEIDRIAKKYNIKVIFDAAHAFGVIVDGNKVANLGDASIFSFHATKVFNTIEGGAVTYKDESYKLRLDDIRNYGIRSPESVMYPGGNGKMSEFHAAMGLCNLRHIEEDINKRKIIDEHYRERLSNIKGIKLNIIKEYVKKNYAYFPVVFNGYKYSRNEVYEKLLKEGITARKYFYPLTNNFECYKNNINYTPVANNIANQILCLPIYSELNKIDVEKICDIISK
ncbi:MAG: aminotransferase [Clostridiales bacterium GWF2_38_85]|nr:MAG: aminotransferase [Clostridiales bacterium GWF2_38_85]HBL84311.1 aminotransferase [Clostridiales bacterium]